MYALLVLFFALLTAIVYWFSGNTSAFSDLGNVERWALSAGISVMLLYAGLFLFDFGANIKRALRDAAIWLGIILVLIIGYAFREEMSVVTSRVAGELVPPGHSITTSQENGTFSVRIRRRSDNHFHARSSVNGHALTMLVDTGASTVVLRPGDARKAGIDVENLSFTIPVNTANGQTFSARVNLREVAIGPIVFRDVEALVAKPGTLNENLLGMSFLRRLRSYEFSKDFLTLRS